MAYLIDYNLMRTILSLLTLLLFVTCSSLLAQTPVQIKVSTEKINENGVIKYVHHVKKGETLFSLAKAYGVTIQDITNTNPNLKAGLQVGMIIFIPTVNSAAATENNTTSNQNEPDHKETKKYQKHIAKWYETIDDIAAKYNVSAKDLMTLNKLTSRELAKRQVLLIPDKNEALASTGVQPENHTEIQQNNTITTHQENSISTGKQTNIAENTISELTSNAADLTTVADVLNFSELNKRTNRDRAVNVSMILPLNGRDSLNLNSNFMEFYAGSLLAIHKLKEKGVNIELDLFDQGSSSMGALTETGKLDNSQIIIGPVRGNDIKEIVGYSNRYSIPVISPMDQSAEKYIAGNPYLVHTPTTSDTQLYNLLAQLKRDYLSLHNGANIIVCSETDGIDTSALRITQEYLNAAHLPYSKISYTVFEGRNMLGKINSLIHKNKKNLVIVPSNNEAFVNDIVRNLSLCIQSDSKSLSLGENKITSIQLYGLPKWRNFETIEPEYFHRMELHLALPYYIDYNNDEVKDFLLKFRALYKTEPSPYAFQGYDITRYFINLLNEYGKEFINVMTMEEQKMLQSDYSFSRKDRNNGFENKATRNVKYNPDYTITTIL